MNSHQPVRPALNCPRSRFFALALAGVLLAASGCRTPQTERAVEKPEAAGPDPELVELARRAEEAIANAGESPGREYANRLGTGVRSAWLKHFKGKGKKPSHPAEAKAPAMLRGLIERVEAGRTWPDPGTYQIPATAEPPVIDGVLNENAWKTAAVWTEIFPFNETAKGGPRTTWHMAWDETHLYVAFDCADSDVFAPERERDEPVFFDDCVEVFILPEFRFRTYWELVVAPNGSVFDAVQNKKPKDWGCIGDPTEDLQGLRHAQTVRGTLNNSEDVDEGYSVEIAVPFNELPGYARCAPQPGDRLHIMLVRLDRTNGEFKAYAFRPLQGWGHNIWNHATMELAE